MDIVSRLKDFIRYLGIQVTQFADNCSIPRPSMSQLLNGRNKKVSNELIGKIHSAYPQLSVLWLMFGQGNMLTDDSVQISTAQNQSTIDFSAPLSPESERVGPSIPFKKEASVFSPEKSAADSVVTPPPISPSFPATESAAGAESVAPPQSQSASDKRPSTPVTLPTNTSKQIVNIIVYYSDNSFESFIPGSL